MTKDKKPIQPQSKGTLPLKGKSVEQFLQEIEENEMIDDHGPVILGGRNRKPHLPDEEKK